MNGADFYPHIPKKAQASWLAVSYERMHKPTRTRLPMRSSTRDPQSDVMKDVSWLRLLGGPSGRRVQSLVCQRELCLSLTDFHRFVGNAGFCLAGDASIW
jgi:hypothetical protein